MAILDFVQYMAFFLCDAQEKKEVKKNCISASVLVLKVSISCLEIRPKPQAPYVSFSFYLFSHIHLKVKGQ